MKRKILSVFMAVALFTSLFIGCSNLFKATDSDASPYENFIVVDVFDSLANFQGIQSGWFAKIVKEKFNMELNIIAPNVEGGGDTLFDIRAAASNVGDLIICSAENGKLQTLVDERLVIDMSEMLADKEIMRYETAINKLNGKLTQKGIYAIPSEISSMPATTPSEGEELTYGPYLRWDVYASIGYPRISTLEDLLPVLKDMQDAMPLSDTGSKTYAFSFFKDWDGNLMNAAKQPACFYGYDEFGFVLAKADGSDYQSIIDSESLYIRNLKLYFKANKMGLVDPDSPTQSFEGIFQKYQDGAILYSPWPWLGQSAYNTIEKKEASKGFMLASIDDMQIFSYGCVTDGNQKTIIAVGSQAEDPKRLADFIDWLYSPEGIQISGAQLSGGTAGPIGLTWEMGEDGPFLTEFGMQALFTSDAIVPEEWGGGTWEDGTSTLNYKQVSQADLDPNGYPYYYSLWPSVLAMEDSPLDIDWQTHMKASTTLDYLRKNNKIIVAPGSGYATPEMSSEIATLRSQCRTVIVDSSWKMIFARNEETFNALLDKMQTKVKSLGYDQVFAEDLKNAMKQDASRKEAAALSAK
ncbi:MAG: type 2 periplasmic-binding domain-containing protein [Mobilitalea sp.]